MDSVFDIFAKDEDEAKEIYLRSFIEKIYEKNNNHIWPDVFDGHGARASGYDADHRHHCPWRPDNTVYQPY